MKLFDNEVNRTIRRRIVYGALYAAGLAVMIFAVINLFDVWNEDRAARAEYDELREIVPEIVFEFAFEIAPADDNDVIEDVIEPEIIEEIEDSLGELYDLNPDFVGWIEISGTDVDYPVVRGRDNNYYLRRTFRGEYNRAGSIFMDFRARRDFSTPVTILYGHNMRDGSMFGTVLRFANENFLNNNREIRIITRNGEMLYYEVISAWRTDAWDDVYFLDFDNAAAAQSFFNHNNSEHFLVLSTCWTGADRDPDDRFIVAAARRG